jgi:hypothetical protein
MSVTRRAFSPIMDGDGALIHSSASLPVKPLLTLNVGKANVVPSLAANRAGCDRERLFHFKAIPISGGADGTDVARFGGGEFLGVWDQIIR